ncbi:MAG: GGDEF domain-containing phosphodiesterase [Eubacterium sp.]|nr:GGDEF domain-containing phosphodiesterase [Eubacterium sp.]
MKRILHFFGLEKRGKNVDAFLDTANFRSSIYMSLLVIVLELWMIISLAVRYFSGDTSRSTSWYISHLFWYVLFLSTACCMLTFSVMYLKGKTKNTVLGKVIMMIFSAVSLYFGVSISYSDYIKGEQILCFVMMVVFVLGLLNWRPVIAIPLSAFIFLWFYHMMENAPDKAISYATQVNYFTLWLTVVTLSLSVYQQRLSEAKKKESLETASLLDELTGIPNMFYFRNKASEILSEDGVNGKLFLYIDIANFKAYNDKYGFDSGNEFISFTAGEVARCFEGDLFARYSDDHFVVLAKRENFMERLSLLVEVIANRCYSPQMNIKAGGFIPVDSFTDPSIALDHARYACSTIKKHSERFYCEYDNDMASDFQKRQYIITHIDDAIKKGYVKPYYQPVVLAEDYSICGAEALARWIDPQYGFLSPADFIPALEEHRLIQRLDKAILKQVCEDLHNGLISGKKVVPVSVNFSRLDFELADVKQILEDYIKEYDIPPDYLHAEITESTLTADDEKLQNTLMQIKNMGISLWLDDFGSGYSSLNTLKEYNFDVMKIDMVFLQGFGKNEKSKSILNSIVTLATMISMETLTEGVDNEEQAEFLRKIGCRRLQGYLFGKPMPIKELRENFNCF